MVTTAPAICSTRAMVLRRGGPGRPPLTLLVDLLLLRLQHDLLAVVFLVAEHPVAFGRILEGHAMRDDEARVDLAPFHPLEQWLHVAMHVALSGPERDRAVHEL